MSLLLLLQSDQPRSPYWGAHGGAGGTQEGKRGAWLHAGHTVHQLGQPNTWQAWVSAWPQEWGTESHFPVNVLEDSSWKVLVRLGAGCLCFLHSPFPVALSVHPKCPWSHASRRIHRQSGFLRFSYSMGGPITYCSRWVAQS